MFGIGIGELLVILVILIVLGVPVWLWGRIVEKAGFSKHWGFITLVPIVNIIYLWLFASARWPNLLDSK